MPSCDYIYVYVYGNNCTQRTGTQTFWPVSGATACCAGATGIWILVQYSGRIVDLGFTSGRRGAGLAQAPPI